MKPPGTAPSGSQRQNVPSGRAPRGCRPQLRVRVLAAAQRPPDPVADGLAHAFRVRPGAAATPYCRTQLLQLGVAPDEHALTVFEPTAADWWLRSWRRDLTVTLS